MFGQFPERQRFTSLRGNVSILESTNAEKVALQKIKKKYEKRRIFQASEKYEKHSIFQASEKVRETQYFFYFRFPVPQRWDTVACFLFVNADCKRINPVHP